MQAMESGERRRPDVGERARERFERGERGERRREIVAREGPGLDRDEMQPPRASRIFPPRVPRGEEAQSEPESRLEDGEAVAVAPASRQVGAGDEDVARLLEAALRGGGVVRE